MTSDQEGNFEKRNLFKKKSHETLVLFLGKVRTRKIERWGNVVCYCKYPVMTLQANDSVSAMHLT